MTSVAATRTAPALPATRTAPALPAARRPRSLGVIAEFGALATEAIRAARAYEGAGSTAARRRVLADFAAGAHRAA